VTEHIAAVLYFAQVHVLYASLVGCAAWVLTALPNASPSLKYWTWVAATLNFIVPVGGLIDGFGAWNFAGATPLVLLNDLAVGISRSVTARTALFGIWGLGASVMVARLVLRTLTERDGALNASEQALDMDAWPSVQAYGVPVRFTEAHQCPSVGGLLCPHIVLPHGIDRLLTRRELDAILIHEVTHARRRDNLIWLAHEITLCLLWFHPLVWLARPRLALYRELSCDERVIQSGHGRDLLAALAKFSDPGREGFLQSSASSFIAQRLARLTAPQSPRLITTASGLLAGLFAVALLAGVAITIAHTACCIISRI
jgi:beta-lactamase regulating signal transducer with metallopeptidase domain